MIFKDKVLDEWVKNNMTKDSQMGKAFLKMMEDESKCNTVINPQKMKNFIASIKNAREYLDAEQVDYVVDVHMFDVTKTNCRYDIICDMIKFDSYNSFESIIKESSWASIGLTNDNRIKITIEFWNVADKI